MPIVRSAFEAARKNPQLMDSLITFASMENGQKKVDAWLREENLYNKVRIGVVTIWDDFLSTQLNAWAKVIVRASDGFFEHEEPYEIFPSEHFKAKVLLVTGGA
jgi:hypothetical protein